MMLRQLATKGPETVGIFRRGPNVRAMRDIREKLDEGGTVDWDQISVFVTAALLKVIHLHTGSKLQEEGRGRNDIEKGR